jgi:hypothetical protein
LNWVIEASTSWPLIRVFVTNRSPRSIEMPARPGAAGENRS